MLSSWTLQKALTAEEPNLLEKTRRYSFHLSPNGMNPKLNSMPILDCGCDGRQHDLSEQEEEKKKKRSNVHIIQQRQPWSIRINSGSSRKQLRCGLCGVHVYDGTTQHMYVDKIACLIYQLEGLTIAIDARTYRIYPSTLSKSPTLVLWERRGGFRQ